MSEKGYGAPIDALDTVCKAYNDCQSCARERHGDQCVSQAVQYKYGETEVWRDKYGEIQGDKFCKDALGSCDRALCECDLAFAKDHVAQTQVFHTDYHLFWSTLQDGWLPEKNCPRGGGKPLISECNDLTV